MVDFIVIIDHFYYQNIAFTYSYCISQVKELLIKANHYANVTDVTLKRVSLNSAEEPSTSDNSTTSAGSSVSLSSDFALTVEMCQCPPNYAGTSCEVR